MLLGPGRHRSAVEGCYIVGCYIVGCYIVGCYIVGCYIVGCYIVGYKKCSFYWHFRKSSCRCSQRWLQLTMTARSSWKAAMNTLQITSLSSYLDSNYCPIRTLWYSYPPPVELPSTSCPVCLIRSYWLSPTQRICPTREITAVSITMW